ncbi:MAG TPA: S8 family serine peptidase [Acidimicrobiales bacterium]|nr:S8 family serine peptidase [Acidimicrobiales bacterium]
MRRALAAAAALVCLSLAHVPAAHAAPRTDVIVKLAAPGGRVAVADALGGDVGLVVAPDTFVVRDVLAGAPTPDGVTWMAPDTTYRAAREPSDTCYLTCPLATSPEGQRELVTVGAAEAWDVTTGSSDVVVAVLDGAVDTSHLDLADKVTAGPSFVSEGCTDATPAQARHATGVAGLAGADTDNGVGMAALGWQTRVLAVAVLDPCGVGRASEVAAGIRYAADHGADIINLSLAGGSNPVLLDAVRYAQGKGILVVAAAGNMGRSDPVYPAAYDGVLAVGSTDADGTRISPFSNRGAWVDLMAPGESIVSTGTAGGYASYDGTSFASPLVAGAAALVLATHPTFTPDDVTARLVRTATRLSGTGGVVDAGAAVVDGPGGYVLLASDGGAFTFGDAVFRGSAGGIRLNQPIVAAATAGTAGYWEAAGDGGVFAYGVPFFGSMGGTRLNQPVVGMASTPSGRGYWLVARDGGIFTFGDAVFAGSTGAITLNQPIVGMASTPSGRGYWLVASDGGIFAFGDAGFSGSAGSMALSTPIVGMAAASRTAYWLVGADGSVFAFGGAAFYGSGVGAAGDGIVGIAPSPEAKGYWLARTDGVALPFGRAVDAGRTPPLNAPIVAIGST